MGKKFMQLHIEVLGSSYDGEMEIRQMMDVDVSPVCEVARTRESN
jgi:hypothetical protein